MLVKFEFDGQPSANCFGTALEALLEGELIDVRDAYEFLNVVVRFQKDWMGNSVVVEFKSGVANVYLGADPHFNPINIKIDSLRLLVSKWAELLENKKHMEFDVNL